MACQLRSAYLSDSSVPLPRRRPWRLRAGHALVEQILAAKQADSSADVSALEAEIDRRVYTLYGLTEAEIAIVEGGR